MKGVLDRCQWCSKHLYRIPGREAIVCEHCDKGHDKCKASCPPTLMAAIIFERNQPR